MDNALTLMIWENRFDVFKYLLERGLDPLIGNEDNLNAFQASILHKRVKFLKFLFISDNDEDAFPVQEGLLFKDFDTWNQKGFWAIDKASNTDGFTLLHTAASVGCHQCLSFILKMIK